MDSIAAKILASGYVEDADGTLLPLHSETPQWQCELLQNEIYAVKPKISLEIGLAYGISSLFICEALQKVGATKHIIIDPHQTSEWRGIGVRNLTDAGYSGLIEFHERYSYSLLPELSRSDLQIDFAYIDTTKLFDFVLVDVFFIQLLMREGGVLFIDDCGAPGIRKVCRFLARHPGWKVYRCLGAHAENPRKKLLHAISALVPKANRIFSSDILTLDSTLGIAGQCIGFQKVQDDNRHWSWFEDF